MENPEPTNRSNFETRERESERIALMSPRPSMFLGHTVMIDSVYEVRVNKVRVNKIRVNKVGRYRYS